MKKKEVLKPVESTYQSVKKILEEARSTAYRAINFAMAAPEVFHLGVCRKAMRRL